MNYKSSIMLSVLCLLVGISPIYLASCGDNENEPDNVITRVQDGNGKVFLEKGILVDANLDYTQSELFLL